jgi:aminoglycoside phosphotransferase (APT) family kinase protein
VDNRHRREIDRTELNGILAVAGIDPARLTSWSELSDATFNTAYRIRVADGPGLVLKVAPLPDSPLLTYETAIMHTEAMFYRLVADAGTVPVPEVVHIGQDRQVIDTDFLLMTECRGDNWSAQRERIGHADRARLRADIGRLVAALHRITGTAFGYPQDAVAPPSASWRTAFLAMVDAILADYARYGTLRMDAGLPLPAEEISERLRAHSGVLDDVTVPALVHFDLWDGNILVDATGPSPAIGGIVDGERAFWGDPIADFVSLALFEDIAQDDAFLAGYRDAGGQVTFDTSCRRRLSLYGIYLDLLMLVEGAPRGYSGPDRDEHVDLTSRHLLTELAILDRPA